MKEPSNEFDLAKAFIDSRKHLLNCSSDDKFPLIVRQAFFELGWCDVVIEREYEYEPVAFRPLKEVNKSEACDEICSNIHNLTLIYNVYGGSLDYQTLDSLTFVANWMYVFLSEHDDYMSVRGKDMFGVLKELMSNTNRYLIGALMKLENDNKSKSDSKGEN